MSPLHYAAENGNYEVIEELCLYGADINAPSEVGILIILFSLFSFVECL